MSTVVTGMSLFMTVKLLLLVAPVDWTQWLWMSFGFLGTSGIIAGAAISQQFLLELSGRVTTVVNLLVSIAAFAGHNLGRRKAE